MKEEATYNLVNQYLNGELPKEEQDAFDNRLDTDQAFAEQVGEYMVTIYLLKQEAREEKKKKFVALYPQESDEQPNSENKETNSGIIRSLPRWLVACAATIALLIVGYFWFGKQDLSNQQLFAEYKTQTYSKVLSEINRSAANQFETAFYNKNYEQALEIAQTELSNSDALQQPIWLERTGFCYWELRKSQKALQVFDQLKSIKEIPVNKNPALWYEALTHLSANNNQLAKESLLALLKLEKHDFYGQAKDLVGKL